MQRIGLLIFGLMYAACSRRSTPVRRSGLRCRAGLPGRGCVQGAEVDRTCVHQQLGLRAWHALPGGAVSRLTQRRRRR